MLLSLFVTVDEQNASVPLLAHDLSKSLQHPKGTDSPPNLTMKDGGLVPNCNEQGFRYLGIDMFSPVNWTKQFQRNKRKTLYLINNICRKRYLSTDQKSKLINTVAWPKILYQSQFIPTLRDRLEKLEKEATNLLNKASSLPSKANHKFWHQKGLLSITKESIRLHINTSLNALAKREVVFPKDSENNRLNK